jgi:DUF177 domain-containing protein
LTTLDPRRPLVLDTRDLGRRAGAMVEVAGVVPAPVGLGAMSLSVPEGSDLALDLRLESVVEGVLVSGTATAQVTGECSRCLDPVTDEVTVDLAELYVYPETDARGRVIPRDPVPDDERDEAMLEGDLLDLEPALRDAVVLALPIAPVCRDECPGLCPQCGFRLEQDPNHQHDLVDARWAALAGLLDPNDDPTHDEKEEG